MRILHVGLLSSYTEGMWYQDNILPYMNLVDGHQVTFVSNADKYVDGVLTSVEEEDTILENGLRLVRVKYDHIINSFVTKKIQKVKKLVKIMEEVDPDVILYHGACGYELMDVSKYAAKNNICLFVDSHEDFTNTSKTFVSKLAYKYIHGYFLKKALPNIEKVLYLTLETKEYLQEMYHLSEDILELYPLGGIIQTSQEQEIQRKKLIADYGLPDNAIILAHSGKLSKEKKTIEIFKAFEKIADNRLYLFVFGSIPDNQKADLDKFFYHERIKYLGWKMGQSIIDILNACDLYLQPGSQSATSQLALCCGCAVLVAPTKSYVDLYGDAVIYATKDQEIYEVLEHIITIENYLDLYKTKGYRLAREKLDYQMLARRYAN